MPFIGNACSFIGSNEEILNNIYKFMDTYPSPFRFWLVNRLYYVVYEPEHLKTVCLKTIEKNEFSKFMEPVLGIGLGTAPGSIWRPHRKLIGPAFNSRILESYVEIFSIQSEVMVENMKTELYGGEFDIYSYKLQWVFRSMSKLRRRLLEIISNRLFKVWLHPDIIFNRTHLGQKHREYRKCTDGFIDDVIKKKKQALVGNSCATVANKKLSQIEGNRIAFLDLLMEGSKLTNKEIRDEINTFIVVGHETTATAECFILLALATHPEIQDKAYKELCEIYGNEDPSSILIKHEDLHRMVYLERIIKETLRMFPILPIAFRLLTDDLNIGDYTLMKGSSVLMGIIKTHRSEEYWTDPLTFNPDRFLPEECAKRHPYTYIPFHAGPRNCIGQTFAMMSMKVLLATVIRKYVIKKDNIVPLRDIKFKFDIALKPVEPITIKIEKRIYRKD